MLLRARGGGAADTGWLGQSRQSAWEAIFEDAIGRGVECGFAHGSLCPYRGSDTFWGTLVVSPCHWGVAGFVQVMDAVGYVPQAHVEEMHAIDASMRGGLVRAHHCVQVAVLPDENSGQCVVSIAEIVYFAWTHGFVGEFAPAAVLSTGKLR